MCRYWIHSSRCDFRGQVCTTREYMERGGAEGVEMIMWLAMRGALGGAVQRVHRNYTAPFTTGYVLLVLQT